MEGTAQELQSLSSTFGFYALHHVRSHSGNMSDIWHCCSKAAARHWKHWKNPQNACPALLAPKSCLCCPWEAGAAQEWCWRMLSHVVCLSGSWHTGCWLWHVTYMKPCRAAAAWGTAQVGEAAIAVSLPLCDRHTKRHESLSKASHFRDSALLLKEEEKNDVPEMVWNKTEEYCPCPHMNPGNNREDSSIRYCSG